MLKYLKEHILEEIDGALDYMEKALEHKGTYMGCTFRNMSEMELVHANALSKMFKDTDKPDEMSSTEYADTQKAVLDKYITAMGKIEAMKKLYWNND